MNKKRVMLWRAACAVVLVLGILLPATSALAHDLDNSDEYIDIIVEYTKNPPAEEDLDPSFKNVETLTVAPIQMMTVPSSSVKDISLMENVSRITYDQIVYKSDSSITHSSRSDNWNQDMIGTFDAWDEGVTGQGVKVAVLDTGFNRDHNDISFTGGHSVFESSNWYEDHDGHGTHVAGIIGANQNSPAAGTAPGVELYGVKIFDKEETTSISNLLNGLNWAIDNNMDIISLSSGYENENPAVHAVIKIAESSGILVVAASGNIKDSSNTDVDFPAAHSEVIAVSNLDSNRSIVSDSKRGEQNELAAPGLQILGLGIDGPDSFRTMSGTSQATPHVAGIAALLMQKYPEESAAQIRARMAEKARDLGEEGRDPIYGYGLVHYLPEQMEEPESEEDVEDGPTEEDDTESDSDDDTETEDGITDEDTDENGNGEEQDSEEIDDTESPQDDLEDDSSPEEEPAEDQESEDGQDDASDADEEDEAEEEPLQSTVWIRPSEMNGMAVIDDEDLEAVADNGLLAISFDSSLENIERVNLTPEQVESIRSRNITLLIVRIDMEWVIPAANLTEGEAFLSFETVQEPLDYSETAHSDLIDFSIEQNDQIITSFPEQMTYRFFTEQAEANQHQLYEWNTDQEEWILLGDTYTNSAVVGQTASVATMAVFDPIELEAAILSSEEPEEIEEVTEEPEEESEEDETEESTRASFGDGDSELPVVLVGGLVILTSVGGGFYFFGGKPKH